jgi:hypothetical protein
VTGSEPEAHLRSRLYRLIAYYLHSNYSYGDLTSQSDSERRMNVIASRYRAYYCRVAYGQACPTLTSGSASLVGHQFTDLLEHYTAFFLQTVVFLESRRADSNR